MTVLQASARTLANLGWPHLLEAVAARCQTERGSATARQLPFLPNEAALHAWRCTAEMVALLRRRLPLPVAGTPDVAALIDRAEKQAVLTAAELLQCAQVAEASAQVRRFVIGLAGEAPLLAAVAETMPKLGPLGERLSSTLESSGRLRDDASNILAEYRSSARRLHTTIRARLDARFREPQFVQCLQDAYVSLRNERYVVPIKASFRSQIPGIVHNASQSGQTVFVELEELVPLGNELTIAQSLASEEELRLLAELSHDVADRADALYLALELLTRLDRTQAQAQLAIDLDATAPRFADEPGFALSDLRHPLLVLQAGTVVANDMLLLASERALVVSGPNAGGKTVALKAAGLATLMAHAGLWISAAPASTVPPLRGIACSMGDAQDLARHLSTFTAHVGELAEMLGRAHDGWLCLIDEIASGTDPTEGAALGQAVLETLAHQGAQVFVTTHLEGIKALGIIDERFANASMGFDPETLAPTFVLQKGTPGVSKALDIAERAGIPADVIARARSVQRDSGALSVALAAINAQRQTLSEAQATLDAERVALTAAQASLATAQRAAQVARLEAEERVRAELLTETAAALELARATIRELQAQKTMASAQAAQGALQDQAARLRSAQARQHAQHTATAGDRRPIAVGSHVAWQRLGQPAEVMRIEGHEAVLQAGALHIRAPLEELRVVSAAAARKSAPRVPAPDASLVLDVRGERVDDAVARLDRFLDAGLRANAGTLRVIHGHGTGALRQALREALTRLPYVADFRTGNADEGGDGVTVVTLR